MNWICGVLVSVPVISFSQVRGFDVDYSRLGREQRGAIANLIPMARTTEGVQNVKPRIKVLMKQGSEVNYDRGKPLFNAVYHDKSGEIVQELLLCGASPNLYDGLIGSPLFLSIERGVNRLQTPKVTKILLEAGANPNTQMGPDDSRSLSIKSPRIDRYNKTPLMLASQYGNEQYAGLLLRYRAKLNTQQKYTKFTALHWAVRNDHASMVAYLLRKGASPYVKDANGRTPIQLAVKLGAKKSIRKLKGT